MAGPKQAKWLSRTRRLTAAVLGLAAVLCWAVPRIAGWLNGVAVAGLPFGFFAVAVGCPLGLALIAFVWQRTQAAIDDDLGIIGD